MNNVVTLQELDDRLSTICEDCIFCVKTDEKIYDCEHPNGLTEFAKSIEVTYMPDMFFVSCHRKQDK